MKDAADSPRHRPWAKGTSRIFQKLRPGPVMKAVELATDSFLAQSSDFAHFPRTLPDALAGVPATSENIRSAEPRLTRAQPYPAHRVRRRFQMATWSHNPNKDCSDPESHLCHPRSTPH